MFGWAFFNPKKGITYVFPLLYVWYKYWSIHYPYLQVTQSFILFPPKTHWKQNPFPQLSSLNPNLIHSASLSPPFFVIRNSKFQAPVIVDCFCRSASTTTAGKLLTSRDNLCMFSGKIFCLQFLSPHTLTPQIEFVFTFALC